VFKSLLYPIWMKKIFILGLIILKTVFVVAQQIPNVSYFMYDYARTNPGSFGSSDMVGFTMIGKSSFSGFPGKPQDGFVNADMPFKLLGAKHGAGFSLYQDELGFYKKYDVKLGYAFRFPIGDGTMGVGLSGSYFENTLNGTWESAGAIDLTNDPNIPKDGSKAKGYGISTGVFYRTEDIYFGASVLNVYTSELKYASGDGSGSGSGSGTGGIDAKEVLKPHYYITSGYYLQLNNPAFELQPAINLYSDGVTVTFDLNATLTYNKKLWGGVSYRAGSSAVGMVGLMILDGLKVGYAYDFQTSAMNRYSTGSHEIMLNYSFKVGVEKTPQRYKSVRFL
jgi:type IX secretion system PorP/SprF family membrane protein